MGPLAAADRGGGLLVVAGDGGRRGTDAREGIGRGELLSPAQCVRVCVCCVAAADEGDVGIVGEWG